MIKFFKFIIIVMLFWGSSVCFSQWSTDPAQNTPICTEPNNQFNPHIVVDEMGNSIIVWEDETDPMGLRHIYAQRLNRYGYKIWDDRGIPVCSAREYKKIADVISDGHGGAIIVWTDWKYFFHPEPIEELDIYAQRIDSTGALLWDYDGVAVCTAENNQFNAGAVTDNEGGAIIVWQDNRRGPNGIYVQRINNYGETVWETNGIDLNDPLAAGSFPDIVTNGLNGAIISYHGPGPNCQNVDSSGDFFWSIDSIVYNQQPLADKEMIADGSNPTSTVKIFFTQF